MLKVCKGSIHIWMDTQAVIVSLQKLESKWSLIERYIMKLDSASLAYDV